MISLFKNKKKNHLILETLYIRLFWAKKKKIKNPASIKKEDMKRKRKRILFRLTWDLSPSSSCVWVNDDDGEKNMFT